MYREKLIEQLEILEQEQQRLIKTRDEAYFRQISKDILEIAKKIDELDQEPFRKKYKKALKNY